MTYQPSLKLGLNTYQNARFEVMRSGSTTWHKGERCTVVEYLPDTYAEPMYRVRFQDGRIGTFKPTELGITAEEIHARFNASEAARKVVAVDPKTGLHVRTATASERAAYFGRPIAHAFHKPVRVGEYLIDEDTGPGLWFGGAGF